MHRAIRLKATMRYIRFSYVAMVVVATFLAGQGSLWMGLSAYPIALFIAGTAIYYVPVALFAVTAETIAHFRGRK